jgi:predicted transposase YdaD
MIRYIEILKAGMPRRIEDKALRQDLLTVMGILAGGKYAAELVYSMIRREMVMQSPIYREWVKEERAEAEEKGRVEGRVETKQEDICKFLARRFGIDSAEIQEKVQQLTNLEILDNVLTELFVAKIGRGKLGRFLLAWQTFS